MIRDDEIDYWRDKSRRYLGAAQSNIKVDNLDLAVSEIYYAMFYEVTALLLTKGLRFKSHSGIKAGFNQEYIKTGIISKDMSRFYNEMTDDRRVATYSPFVEFEKEEVKEWLELAKEFIEEIEGVIQEEM